MSLAQNPPPKMEDPRLWDWLYQFWTRTKNLEAGTIDGLQPLNANLTSISGLTGSANQIIGKNAANSGYELKTLTQGANVTITYSSGAVTFAVSSFPYGSLTGAPTTWAWGSITGTPTTLSGYGITDATTSSSGTYTPTLTNGTNVDASTAYACQWMRVGNTVTVSGVFDVDATAAGAWDIGISLPVSSNFSAVENAGGTAVLVNTASVYGYARITADATNDRLKVEGITTGSTASEKFSFTVTYLVV